MIEVQVLSKILEDKSTSILDYNQITDDYFVVYADEFQFIRAHQNSYGAVPDVETFLDNFPDFEYLSVREPQSYLVEKMHEEYAYRCAIPVMNELMTILREDSFEAFEFLQSKLPTLQPKRASIGVDIIGQAEQRYKSWLDRRSNPEAFFISTGFPQLDDIFLGGWQRGEEFVVVFSRTGQGKTWQVIFFLKEAWKLGYRIGLLEPEMSAVKTGYRFDTLLSNFSNTALVKGDDVEGYSEYITQLKSSDTPFFVAHPRDFNRKVTVSKLRSWAISQKLDVLAIDGISYLSDERAERGDNRTTQLTHISEDLMSLSIELSIPIIVVAQSNREGASDSNAPELENIRDSDGIAYNATKILSIKSSEAYCDMYVRKNRDNKFGQKLSYFWNADLGIYKFMANIDSNSEEVKKESKSVKSQYTGGSEVF